MLQISVPVSHQLSTHRIQTKAYAALQSEDTVYPQTSQAALSHAI